MGGCRVLLLLLGLGVSLAAGQVRLSADPPRSITDTNLLAGHWQSVAQRLNLNLLAGGRALVELAVDETGKPGRIALGTYRAVRPGLWRLEVREPDHTLHVWFVSFEDAHRLVVVAGNQPPFRMYRAGRSFAELDRDGDGYISRPEAEGSPLELHFQEFGGGERMMVDRAAYERFLAKYPHRGSAR